MKQLLKVVLLSAGVRIHCRDAALSQYMKHWKQDDKRQSRAEH
jgi:hypothetical protein